MQLKGKKKWLTLLVALIAALLGVDGCALRHDVRMEIDGLLDELEDDRPAPTEAAVIPVPTGKFALSLSRQPLSRLLRQKRWA